MDYIARNMIENSIMHDAMNRQDWDTVIQMQKVQNYRKMKQKQQYHESCWIESCDMEHTVSRTK